MTENANGVPVGDEWSPVLPPCVVLIRDDGGAVVPVLADVVSMCDGRLSLSGVRAISGLKPEQCSHDLALNGPPLPGTGVTVTVSAASTMANVSMSGSQFWAMTDVAAGRWGALINATDDVSDARSGERTAGEWIASMNKLADEASDRWEWFDERADLRRALGSATDRAQAAEAMAKASEERGVNAAMRLRGQVADLQNQVRGLERIIDMRSKANNSDARLSVRVRKLLAALDRAFDVSASRAAAGSYAQDVRELREGLKDVLEMPTYNDPMRAAAAMVGDPRSGVFVKEDQ